LIYSLMDLFRTILFRGYWTWPIYRTATMDFAWTILSCYALLTNSKGIWSGRFWNCTGH
jgi:hypothetical protein